MKVMGNQCCASRDQSSKQSGSGWSYLGEIICCAGQDRGKAAKGQAGRHVKLFELHKDDDDDVSLFDKAYDTNDIEGFVRLLDSKQEIDKLDERMHPWAADPRTVGALAATQLAILASREQEPQIKDTIRQKGGIPPLVNLLGSKDVDRVHAAVVALSFLSVDNAENAVEMFENGVMPHLVNGMRSSIDGMRAATAQTARNIYVLDMRYKKEFVKAGGVVNLVDLLRPDLKNAAGNDAMYTHLEAIYHLEDLILDGGTETPEYAQAVRNAGALAFLNDLAKSPNADLADAAHFLSERLK